MPRMTLKLALGLALALLCPQTGLAQMLDDLDAIAAGASEHEALITALDELGLNLDSPELDGMDAGEVWDYIERERREREGGGQDAEGGDQSRRLKGNHDHG